MWMLRSSESIPRMYTPEEGLSVQLYEKRTFRDCHFKCHVGFLKAKILIIAL